MNHDNLSTRLSQIVRRLARRARAWLSGIDYDAEYLAEALDECRSDSHKVDILRSLSRDVEDGSFSGAGVAWILRSFSRDNYKVDALEVLSGKISRPVSPESKVAILDRISGPFYKAKASEILVHG